MKKHLLLSLLCIAFLMQTSFAQDITYIWGGPGDPNSEFAGGLNDWTVNAVSPNENAVWIWKADGRADQGAYWGTREPIVSPSVANGVALFDSDFYDNAGIQGNFGNGVAPAPQNAELISPVFSCADQTQVWLQFNQVYRNYQSSTYYAVSIDGGSSWMDPVRINGDVALNASTLSDSRILANISDMAAGHENVRIKFIWQGDYYFWMIDDVYVIGPPPADPVILGTWYPPMHYGIPHFMMDRDSMFFAMDVTNIGGETVTDMEVAVTLYNSDLDKVYYTDTRMIDILEADSIERIFFDSYLMPSDCDTGLYVVDYQIIGEGFATPNKKLHRQFFRVYPMVEDRKEGAFTVYTSLFKNTDFGHDSYVSYQGGGAEGPVHDVYCINYYKTGKWVESPYIKVKAVSGATKVFTADPSGSIVSYPLNFRLFEVSDDVEDLLWNFEFDDGIGLDGKQSTQLTFLGYANANIENVPNTNGRRDAGIPIFDLDDEDGVALKPSTKYFFSALWERGVRYYQAYDNTNGGGGDKRFYYFFDELWQRASLIYTSNGQRFFLIGNEYGAWDLDMDIEVWKDPSVTKDQLLPENTVVFHQNPVRNVLTADISFENSIDHATIVIHNLNGSVIHMRNIYNVSEASESFQTGHLSSGEYIFTVFTKDKLLSKKFIVVK
jgi:hypothetical protein